jgi:hypothetical protein
MDETHQMNIDTGKIVMVGGGNEALVDDLMKRLVPVRDELMTDKQRTEQAVSLHDHRSPLGRQLTEVRKVDSLSGKYAPHVGAKQLAKRSGRKP